MVLSRKVAVTVVAVVSLLAWTRVPARSQSTLGIVRGEARVCFGGPNGQVVGVCAGDVVVIPAGVAHKNEGASKDLLVVGGYPKGQDWDICPAKPDERGCAAEDIAKVGLPGADPVYGQDGPLIEQWNVG